MSPLFVAAVSRVILGERPHPFAWLAALLALFGVALIFSNGLTQGNWLGSAVAIAVALCFAGQTVTLRRYRHFDMMPAICIGGMLAFISAGLFGGGLGMPIFAIALLAAMGAVQLAIPLILYARSARYVPAATLSLIALLDAILNPFWSWLGVGETPSLETVLGGVVILTAVALSIFAGRALGLEKEPAKSSN
jgi:drug/metabolite transporter (DMT)-like permease